MTRAAPARVLVDLSHAADGYVGIAQDTRLIFDMLASLPGVEASGLLMPTGRHDLPRVHPRRAEAPALTAAVLHCMARNWAAPESRRFPFSLVQKARRLAHLLRTDHHLLPLADRAQLNAVWRTLFARTLPPAQRPLVLEQSFFATDLSVSGILDRSIHFPRAWPKRLQAGRFDYALFCMPRPVRLPPGTRQMVRFHDAVPVTDIDTCTDWRAGLVHSRLVRFCARDAVFVCNSPQSLDNLLTLDPERGAEAHIIPCALAPPVPGAERMDPAEVILRHASFRALGPDAAPPPGWAPPAPWPRYVLSVSTLEPRKNYPGLVRAFERAAADDPELRLVIVGGRGWREDAPLRAMRAGVASGRILHLQDVPTDELHALMAGCACFAFPSFNEGFGYSPLEAMQAGAPCIVSDLPVFRWIFGDSVLYVDPYDPDAVAAGLRRLLDPGTGAELRQTLCSRAGRVLARFRPEAVRQEWEALFDLLRSRR
jgi:glycosyltransferase involved in cell wall biosynthesis